MRVQMWTCASLTRVSTATAIQSTIRAITTISVTATLAILALTVTLVSTIALQYCMHEVTIYVDDGKSFFCTMSTL